MTRLLFMMVISVFLAGCSVMVPWVKTPTGEYKDGDCKFSAQLPSDWMRFTQGKSFILTRDGVVLDQIIVTRKDVKTPLEFTKTRFKADMMMEDLANVEIDNYRSNSEWKQFDLLTNEPVTLAGQEAFKITFNYTTSSGLVKRCIHYGFFYKGDVYRIIYEAADQYYYTQNEKVFTDFLASFKLID